MILSLQNNWKGKLSKEWNLKHLSSFLREKKSSMNDCEFERFHSQKKSQGIDFKTSIYQQVFWQMEENKFEHQK